MNLVLIKLQAIHPQQNIRRFYSIRIGQDLFKKWHVAATYGRLGTDGRLKSWMYESQEDAYRSAQKILHKRFHAEKRIGVNYILTYLSVDSSVAHRSWVPRA